MEEQSSTIQNSIRVSELLSTGISFRDALVNKNEEVENQTIEKVSNFKPFSILQVEGGNLILDLDEDDYNQGIEDLQFSVVGYLFLSRTFITLTTMLLREKLSLALGTRLLQPGSNRWGPSSRNPADYELA